MALVDDAEGWRRLLASLSALSHRLDGSSEGMHVVRRPGVVATVTPATPERSLVNDVVYTGREQLADAYDELVRIYADAGIRAWTVWVPDHDRATAELLAERGHLQDGDPEAMVLDLDLVERPAPPEGFDGDGDPLAMARLNDAAYGIDGSFERALLLMRRSPSFHIYTAGRGAPEACVMSYDHGDDCSIWFVATAPHARGRGYATALAAHALADGRDRGCTTSTLQASDAGRPIYERLGYRSLGEIELWERRI